MTNLEFWFRQNNPKASEVFKTSEVYFGFNITNLHIKFWHFDIV